MKKFSALIIVSDVRLEGLENFEASTMLEAVEIALDYASKIGGELVRVESCDFGAFEFVR